jgi:hypothetical protein
VDLTAALAAQHTTPPKRLALTVEGCLVVERGSIPQKGWTRVDVRAGGSITWAAHLTASPTDAGAWIDIKGATGHTIADDTRFQAGGWVYVGARSGNMVIGDRVRLESRSDFADAVVAPGFGNLIAGSHLLLRAVTASRLMAIGAVTVGPNLDVMVTGEFGGVQIDGNDGVTIDDARQIKAQLVDVTSFFGGLVALRHSHVKITGIPGEGVLSVWSRAQPFPARGPVDVTGLTWSPDATFVSIIGNPVIR